MAGLPPGVIVLQVCSVANHWAQQFQAHGHPVQPLAPKPVMSYRQSGKLGKDHAADAAVICEAMQQPTVRFVPIKPQEQQAPLRVHRALQGFITERTAWTNRIRGLLSEFGIVLPLTG
jgi:transposase